MKKILTAFLFLIIFCPVIFASDDLKKPNVSGQFYDADPQRLKTSLDKFFSLVNISPLSQRIEILIAPHAGYVYSGQVAAYGYQVVSSNRYSTIVIIAPSHFADFEGFAIWPSGQFETPLGRIEVDHAFAQKLLAANRRVQTVKKAFEREHALEVQLPFIQRTFKDAKIVPVLTGRPNKEDCQLLAQSLQEIIAQRDDVLIIVSSDMSHYYKDDIARKMDFNSLDAIKHLRIDDYWNGSLQRSKMEMCGFVGTATALFYAELKRLDGVDILQYANSGDVTGERDRVVGYSSIVFYKKEGSAMTKENIKSREKELNQELNLDQKKKLLEIARKTMTAFIERGEKLSFKELDPRLSLKEGAFVTIHKNGRLRGCIGNIIGQQPLYETIRDMAIASASEDPRFSRVSKDELKDLEIEISVLSVPKRVTDVNKIIMGVHGVIVGQGMFHRGVFLPQVATETGWSREEFLSELCSQKAGLSRDAWKDPKTTLEIFTAQVFSEKDLGLKK